MELMANGAGRGGRMHCLLSTNCIANITWNNLHFIRMGSRIRESPLGWGWGIVYLQCKLGVYYVWTSTTI